MENNYAVQKAEELLTALENMSDMRHLDIDNYNLGP